MDNLNKDFVTIVDKWNNKQRHEFVTVFLAIMSFNTSIENAKKITLEYMEQFDLMYEKLKTSKNG